MRIMSPLDAAKELARLEKKPVVFLAFKAESFEVLLAAAPFLRGDAAASQGWLEGSMIVVCDTREDAHEKFYSIELDDDIELTSVLLSESGVVEDER